MPVLSQRHKLFPLPYSLIFHFLSRKLRNIMEVELGVKITKTRHDITSISDFQFAKDRAGPRFLSKQTETKFILTAHLKGYKNENIHIRINEDGSLISISGEKAVQEMVIIPFKKEVKIKDFRKKFKIPDGVVLDKIKATYNGEESILTIVMPKMATGISGVGIEEVKEEDIDRKTPEPEQTVVADKVSEKGAEEPIQEKKQRKPKKPCPLLLMGGSSLLVSLIILVINYIRAKNK